MMTIKRLGGMMMLPLRAVQMFLAFVVLGLSGYVANWYNVDTLTSSPTQINFLAFSAVFTILTLVYQEAVPRFMPRFSLPIVHMILEVANALFYFAGTIALGVFLNSLLFCRGAVCGAARADAGISGVQWLIFTLSAVFVIAEMAQGGFRKPLPRAGAKGSYPKDMMKETPA